jgi:DtxR family Mn-dependent transcriptional regulator
VTVADTAAGPGTPVADPPAPPVAEPGAAPAPRAPRASRRRRGNGVAALPVRTVAIDRYLETIFCIAAEDQPVRPTRIAHWLGVKAPTVSIGLRRLRAGGWIQTEMDRRVSLTPAGREAAEAIVRRHRLAECWLTDVLGLDWASAHLEANRLAASFSDAVLARLDRVLDRPAICPHGHAIPGRSTPYGTVVALADVPPGATATVRRISEIIEHESFQLLRDLAAAGVRTGVEVTVDAGARSGEVSLSVGDRRHALAVDPAAARLIWVEVASPPPPGPAAGAAAARS